MKKLIENFNKYLIPEAELNSYIEGGMIRLYHYSKANQEELEIDPARFADKKTRSSYSSNEYNVSTVPRTFFYVDVGQREKGLTVTPNLYSLDIPANRVYDLRTDTEGYKEKIRHPVYGLRKGVEWDELLLTLREKYDGVFYGGGFDVVSLFVPKKAKRLSDEEREALER